MNRIVSRAEWQNVLLAMLLMFASVASADELQHVFSGGFSNKSDRPTCLITERETANSKSRQSLVSMHIVSGVPGESISFQIVRDPSRTGSYELFAVKHSLDGDSFNLLDSVIDLKEGLAIVIRANFRGLIEVNWVASNGDPKHKTLSIPSLVPSQFNVVVSLNDLRVRCEILRAEARD